MRRMLALAAIATTVVACGSGDDDGDTTASTSTSGTAGGNDGGTGGEGGQGGSLVPMPVDVDLEVTRYAYRFDLTTAAASSELTLDIGGDGNCVTLPSTLPATSARLDAEPATAVHDGSHLQACASTDLGPTATLTTDQIVPEQTFLGLDVGFSRRNNQLGGTMTYLLSWVGGCDRFGPCDDDPARLTTFDFEVTHPPGTTVLCPGTLMPGATTTRCLLDAPLAPTYSAFAIVADDTWVATPLTTAAGVDITFYEAPGGGLMAALDPAEVAAFMTWITGLLGPYPYGDELRLATGPTAWLGFEHPANIVLRYDLQALGLPYGVPPLHVTMHEIIHQWAGDHVTLATTADFVWKEAICEYLAYVFEDEQIDSTVADLTRAYWDDIAIGAQFHPRPLDEPTPPVESFYGDVYGPGPMVLFQQLEPLIGRSAVLAGIADFLSEPGARGVDDLRVALEAASSADLAPWFDAWVFGTGTPTWPTFAATAQQAGDQVTVTVEQLGVASPKGGVVEIDVVGPTASVRASVDFGLAPTEATAETTVTLGEAFTSLVVDPEHRILNEEPGLAAASRPVWPL